MGDRKITVHHPAAISKQKIKAAALASQRTQDMGSGPQMNKRCPSHPPVRLRDSLNHFRSQMYMWFTMTPNCISNFVFKIIQSSLLPINKLPGSLRQQQRARLQLRQQSSTRGCSYYGYSSSLSTSHLPQCCSHQQSSTEEPLSKWLINQVPMICHPEHLHGYQQLSCEVKMLTME